MSGTCHILGVTQRCSHSRCTQFISAVLVQMCRPTSTEFTPTSESSAGIFWLFWFYMTRFPEVPTFPLLAEFSRFYVTVPPSRPGCTFPAFLRRAPSCFFAVRLWRARKRSVTITNAPIAAVGNEIERAHLQGGPNKNVPLDKLQFLHNQWRFFNETLRFYSQVIFQQM